MRERSVWIVLAVLAVGNTSNPRAEDSAGQRRAMVRVVTFLDAGSDSIVVSPEEMTTLLLGALAQDPGFDLEIVAREPNEPTATPNDPDVLVTGFYRLKDKSIHVDLIVTLRSGKSLTRQISEVDPELVARQLHDLIRGAFCTVSIETTPPGASVRLDDEIASTRTPLTLESVLQGRHALLIEHEGHARIERILDVDKDVALAFTLEPAAGAASVEPTAGPEVYGFVKFRKMPWAQVYVDGHLLGDTSSLRKIRLEVGEHEIRMISPEAGVKTLRIQVRANETHAANF